MSFLKDLSYNLHLFKEKVNDYLNVALFTTDPGPKYQNSGRFRDPDYPEPRGK